MRKIAILGGGIAGLSAGWFLKQQGVDFVILEKQAIPGGMARSFRWHDFWCDFAAHRLFSNDEKVLQALLSLTPMSRQIRRSRLYLGGRWMRDPLDVNELIGWLPLPKKWELVWSYLNRPRDLPEENFENFVLRKYGRSLYQAFFQPYTEKLFGIPGSQISVLWARQKVRLASPFDKLRKSTHNKFSYFYYPVQGGYGAIVNSLYEKIKEQVWLETQVLGCDFSADGQRIETVRYKRNDAEDRLEVDGVISTLPLTLTGRLLGQNYPLHFQKVDAVYLLINRPQVTENHWIYFTDADVCINRMVEFKNMSAVDTPADTSVLCAEVTQQHADPAAKVAADLVRMGLIKENEVLDRLVVREEFAYPVYDQTHSETLKKVQTALNQVQNLYVVGRAAEFRHRELDDNFSAAARTVETLLARQPELAPAAAPAVQPAEVKLQPKVSTVILTFNHYEDTRECLLSLQHGPQTHIILVDNGSSDGTPAKVRQEFPDVEVIENPRNLGVPAGYNVGFARALQQGCDYIFMVNNDTVVAPDLLPTLLKTAEADPACAVVMPRIFYYPEGANYPAAGQYPPLPAQAQPEQIWSNGGYYRRFPPAIINNDRRPQSLGNEARRIEYAPGCGLLIHRRAFEKAGLFDPGYFFWYDDWDFCERVRELGLNIWLDPRAAFWHKVSRTTQPTSPLFWRVAAASTVRFYRRHGRPTWLSLPIHLSYIMLREILWKGNLRFLGVYLQGLREGFHSPLEDYPDVASTMAQDDEPA
ncbi:MAG TPA: glycosyltransferase [Anaerolineaceae bacterium]|nr:glycosyltransferase [Anaerolineaceae bacterium]HPN53493.1 glycosyltransferase [Anaerolineaceae bacterium]